MTRPHPLALTLFLVLLLTVLWLNNESGIGIQLFDSDFGSKFVKEERIGNPYVLKGWPFQFWSLDAYDRLFSFPPAILSALICITLSVLPAYTLHRLLRRTLQIHLASAVLLMLAAATLLTLNLVPSRSSFSVVEEKYEFNVLMYGWPQSTSRVNTGLKTPRHPGMPGFGASEQSYDYAILGNALIALATLSLVLLLSESLLARRKSPREVTP